MLGGRNQAGPHSRPIYSFPELKNNEILQCMDDLRIPLTLDDLTKPSPAVVQRIYESFADIFMGMGKDHYGQQSSLKVTDGLEHPDLQIDSVSLVAFYRLVLRLMIEVGIEDFSLRDLIRPEYPRLRIILSAIINFAKFREEQLAVFEELSRRSEDAVEQKAKLSKRREELLARISSIRSKQKEQEPAVNSIKNEMAEMLQTLRDLKKDQTAISSALDSLKSSKQDSTERLAQIQFLLGNIRQECNKLKSRVVHSPEKLLQIIAEMNSSISSEKQNLAAIEKKSRDLQMKLEALASLEQDLLRTLQGLESLGADLKKKDELLGSVQAERDSIERHQIQSKDLAIKETQLSRQIQSAHEKLVKLQGIQLERRAKLAKRLEELQRDYRAVSEERSNAMLKIEQSEKIVKDFETKMSDIKRAHEAEIVAMRGECVALKAKVFAYTNELKKALCPALAPPVAL